MNKPMLIMLALVIMAVLSACSTSSERAAWNLNYEAEEFQLSRRIAAINGITNEPLFEIIGQC